MNLVTHPLFLAALRGSVAVILWPRPQEGEESSEDETTETKDEFGTHLEEPPTPEAGDEDTAEERGRD